MVLNNWLDKHSKNDQENGVLLLEFSKICRLCLKESLNMYGIRNHLVEFEEGSLFLKKVIEILIDEVHFQFSKFVIKNSHRYTYRTTSVMTIFHRIFASNVQK